MKFAISVVALIVLAGNVRAGIYNTSEEDDIRLSKNASTFRQTLAKIRSIGFDKVEFDPPIRKRYMLLEALGGAKPPETLTLEQKLDYSAALLRRKKFQQAIDFLTPLTRQHPEIFLFDSHLAMAYWGSGQQGFDRRAIEVLTQMLSKRGWPENFHDLTDEQRMFLSDAMYWNEGTYEFYRKSEQALLKLMKLRLGEKQGERVDAVDALFDAKFVGDDGKFQPGKIAAAEKRKLPGDALETVEQLSLWLPEDLRLYWLLGELANAEGSPENVKAANTIFTELIESFGFRARDLRDRREMLTEHVQGMEEAPATFDDLDKKLTDVEKREAPPISTRTLLIAFITGLAVGIFAVWQYQEIRRRRRGG